MIIEVKSANEMIELGQRIGGRLQGGDVIELVGDVGAGKTTFTKGLALGLGVADDVQSPTFTLSRVYPAAGGRVLAHYDFYRLNNAGIMAAELDESINDTNTITVVEWAEIVADVLPDDKIKIEFVSPTESSRHLTLGGSSAAIERIMERQA